MWNQLLWSNKFGPVYSKWLVSMATTHNLGCQKINTNLAISFLSWNIERHVTYQITALPEFYKMEFQNQLPWLPGCYSNQRSCQNSLTFQVRFPFGYHSNRNYKYNFTFRAPDCQQTSLLLKSILNVCIFYVFPWKYFIVPNDTEMPFAVKSPFTTGRATLPTSTCKIGRGIHFSPPIT